MLFKVKLYLSIRSSDFINESRLYLAFYIDNDFIIFESFYIIRAYMSSVLNPFTLLTFIPQRILSYTNNILTIKSSLNRFINRFTPKNDDYNLELFNDKQIYSFNLKFYDNLSSGFSIIYKNTINEGTFSIRIVKNSNSKVIKILDLLIFVVNQLSNFSIENKSSNININEEIKEIVNP